MRKKFAVALRNERQLKRSDRNDTKKTDNINAMYGNEGGETRDWSERERCQETREQLKKTEKWSDER